MTLPEISFEFFPPRDLEASFRLWDTVQVLAPLAPRFVSVTYGAGGTTRDLTRDAVEETRKVADQMSEDARLMAAAKSPTELVKLQGDIMRRSFDHVVATGSKNTEAWIKLTNEAFAPLTSRMSETVDKMNKLAA